VGKGLVKAGAGMCIHYLQTNDRLSEIGKSSKFKHAIMENSRGGLFRAMDATEEIRAHIRNKLTPAKTALDLLSKAKMCLRSL